MRCSQILLDKIKLENCYYTKDVELNYCPGEILHSSSCYYTQNAELNYCPGEYFICMEKLIGEEKNIEVRHFVSRNGAFS